MNKFTLKNKGCRILCIVMAVVVMLSLTFVISGCKKEVQIDKRLVGSWEYLLGRWVFRNDGTCIIHGLDGTYETNGSTLIFHNCFGETEKFTYAIGTYQDKDCIIIDGHTILSRVG